MYISISVEIYTCYYSLDSTEKSYWNWQPRETDSLPHFTPNLWRGKSVIQMESPLQFARLQCSVLRYSCKFDFLRRKYVLLRVWWASVKSHFFFICCTFFVLTTTFDILYPINLHLEYSEKQHLKFLSFGAILLEKERFYKNLENGQCLIWRSSMKWYEFFLGCRKADQI